MPKSDRHEPLHTYMRMYSSTTEAGKFLENSATAAFVKVVRHPYPGPTSIQTLGTQRPQRLKNVAIRTWPSSTRGTRRHRPPPAGHDDPPPAPPPAVSAEPPIGPVRGASAPSTRAGGARVAAAGATAAATATPAAAAAHDGSGELEEVDADAAALLLSALALVLKHHTRGS